MTPVRGKRAKLVHATHNMQRTLCNKRCSGWVVETSLENVTCEKCHLILTTN